MSEYVHEKVCQFKCKKICQTNFSWKILQIILLQSSSQSYGGKTFNFTNRRLNLWKVWGLSIYKKYAFTVKSSWGSIYPLSEHVDIFPVRLVPTFPLSILRLPYSNHLSYVVVFILAGGIKDKGWILLI